jgi:hypothetical protein
MNSLSFARPLVVLLVLVTFASQIFAADAGHRRYADVHIDVFTSPFDGQSGCHGDFGAKGKMVCGYPGHVSELSWTFARSSSAGDVYQITRRYPADTDTPSSETKEVTYAGKALTLWQDDYQKIILRPKQAA